MCHPCHAMNKPQGTVVHVTKSGACLCTECATTTYHFDLIDGWIYMDDPVTKTILDGSTLLVMCEGCNQPIDSSSVYEQVDAAL